MCYHEAELIGCCVATLKLRMAFGKDLSLVLQSLSMRHHTHHWAHYLHGSLGDQEAQVEGLMVLCCKLWT